MLMSNQPDLQRLIGKWTSDAEGFKSEAQRLENSDRSRHETSIAMLEARAQAIERCILDLEGAIAREDLA
jgi:hypothetical protein